MQKKTENKKNLKVPVECYSRIVGYYRPVSDWHIKKQAEFRDRKEYIINEKELRDE